MNEIAIKKHSFDLAKNRLKEFSEKTEAELEIDKVKTDGDFFGLGDHKVTGYELNIRLETIQGNFIAVNTINNKVIKEFREVYNALDALDRDYITSIVANVKAIEKTSNDVSVQQGILKQHNEKLANQQSKLDAHQIEIEKNVANISKIVAALKVFKEKLEGYKHLTDIDKIWNDCKSIQNEIRVVSDSITKFSKKTTEDIATANNKNKALSDQVNRDILTLRNEAKSFKEFFSDLSEKLESTANLLDRQIPVIKEIDSFTEQLKKLTHIDDVDSMWDDINKTREDFATVENSLQNIEADVLQMQKHLEEIDSFVVVLSGYTHLQDIDNMWDDLDVCKKNIEKINGNIQAQQSELDNLTTTSENHMESIATLFKNFADIEEYAADSRKLITKLETFREDVSSLNHLMEIDEIWKQTEDHQTSIKRVEQESKSHRDKLNELEQTDDTMHDSIHSNSHNISVLKKYIDKLSGISHLEDVDGIWKDFEEHTSKLLECEKKDEDLAITIQKNKEEANNNIAEAVQTVNATIEILTKKVKYAYWIAGCLGGLATIEFILLLVKVM
ncbi:hypothetical protein [Peptoanaerobacter stomatis]|uniref:hypothetical protein n=1 Tax=Peptoanaerobacter stomatis TaxID=796937 RepID=UPI003F9FF713